MNLKTTHPSSDLSYNVITKTPLLNDGDVESKRAEILEYFHDSFSLYESLFKCLATDEAYFRRANNLRQPLIFYYGHTAVFFINKLNVANLINQRVDPQMESLLAIGVDEMSWDDLNDKNYDWPTPEKVKWHRDQTRGIVDKFIRECDFSMPIDWNSPMWIILMGIEHERIHLETSSILMRELPIEMVKDHPVWGNICRSDSEAPQNELIKVDGGKVELGKSKTNPIYGWDNEYGYAAEEVKSFKASKYIVSNQEFLEFVEDGGYQNKTLWTDEGWGWIEFSKAQHPVYWLKDETKSETKSESNGETNGETIREPENDRDAYRLRTMVEIIDMPWSWPAEINYLEAKAFCNWKSEKTGRHFRMPTEAEWHQLRNAIDTDQPYWETAPGNLNLEHGMSPCPVDQHGFENGFFDVVGNVWQWTETPIDGFGGFEVHPTYDDFSTPTFDGKHNIFKGGCWISTGNYAIKDARYAFRRHFFQYSGLRYVEAAPLPKVEPNVYETDQMVSRYIEFHYGQLQLDVPNFPKACIEEVARYLSDRKTRRALDIGCATARSAFELAKHFDHVDAVDLSVRLIEAPANLQKNGRQRFVITQEGDLNDYREVNLSDFKGYEAVKDKVAFLQGDACNLVEKYNEYDLVFAGNLIDRLYDPEKFLKLIKNRIVTNGLLVLVSPYNWDEEHTPREKWLGGFKDNTGENFTTFEGVQKILAPEFTLLGDAVNLPFAIRETERTWQYGQSELTVWQKK